DVSPPRDYDLLFPSPRELALVTLSTIVSDPPVKVDGRFLTFKSASVPAAVGLWHSYFKDRPELLSNQTEWLGAIPNVLTLGNAVAILVLGRIADNSLLPVLSSLFGNCGTVGTSH